MGPSSSRTEKTPLERFHGNKHATFEGVYLKHYIKGADILGLLSCHVVNCRDKILEEHVHENQWELHEVLSGEGEFVLESKNGDYRPGVMGVIPKGKKHKVRAGKNGLILLAKFFPALV